MTLSALEQAQSLARPSREAMLQRHPTVQRFWEENRGLFEEAWSEWEQKRLDNNSPLDGEVFDPALRQATDEAWLQPSHEGAVRELWNEVLPGVFEAQFMDVDALASLRDYLNDAADANIPLRPPYGIVLNRGGAMLDPRSEGYLAAPSFQAFYRKLMDHYMRPISRLLFPEITGYDTETFGFSVQWEAGKDVSLRPHTDASSVTLNINLNLPDEEFSGSAVGFFDRSNGQKVDYTFKPGYAVIHRGDVPHISQPITKGSRSNLILWLYGEGGATPSFEVPPALQAPEVRWSHPKPTPSNFAPF